MHNSIHLGPQLAFLYISIVVICTFFFTFAILFFTVWIEKRRNMGKEGRERGIEKEYTNCE